MMQKIEITEKDFPLKLNHQELIQDLAQIWGVEISDISITQSSGGILKVETLEGVEETVLPAKIIIEANTNKALSNIESVVKNHNPDKSTAEQSILDEQTILNNKISNLSVIKNILERLEDLESGK